MTTADGEPQSRAELLRDIEQLHERARKFRPLPIPFVDGHQCLRVAFAQVLRVPVAYVPSRCEHEDLDVWERNVEERFGVRLEVILAGERPPAEPWVAIVPGHGEYTHAVAAFGDAPDARGWLTGYRVVAA